MTEAEIKAKYESLLYDAAKSVGVGDNVKADMFIRIAEAYLRLLYLPSKELQ